MGPDKHVNLPKVCLINHKIKLHMKDSSILISIDYLFLKVMLVSNKNVLKFVFVFIIIHD